MLLKISIGSNAIHTEVIACAAAYNDMRTRPVPVYMHLISNSYIWHASLTCSAQYRHAPQSLWGVQTGFSCQTP
jgi:hypothetical protein